MDFMKTQTILFSTGYTPAQTFTQPVEILSIHENSIGIWQTTRKLLPKWKMVNSFHSLSSVWNVCGAESSRHRNVNNLFPCLSVLTKQKFRTSNSVFCQHAPAKSEIGWFTFSHLRIFMGLPSSIHGNISVKASTLNWVLPCAGVDIKSSELDFFRLYNPSCFVLLHK